MKDDPNDMFEAPHLTLLAFLDSAENPLTASVGQDWRDVNSLLRQLKSCPRTLPDMYRAMLGLPIGVSFGETAVYLLRQIVDDNEV